MEKEIDIEDESTWPANSYWCEQCEEVLDEMKFLEFYDGEIYYDGTKESWQVCTECNNWANSQVDSRDPPERCYAYLHDS